MVLIVAVLAAALTWYYFAKVYDGEPSVRGTLVEWEDSWENGRQCDWRCGWEYDRKYGRENGQECDRESESRSEIAPRGKL